MQCKNHPERHAEYFCASCGIPLCEDCAEETASGERHCFQCAMFQTVSGVGSSLRDRREKAAEKKLEDKKKWGPFQYFLVASAALVVVMWGVILFGGHKAPAGNADFDNNRRVLLFMVDGAIKRYAHYRGNKYPENITDLIPRYLSLREEDRVHLALLSYERDPNVGYRLSLTNPKPGEMRITISSKGIEYETPLGEGA